MQKALNDGTHRLRFFLRCDSHIEPMWVHHRQRVQGDFNSCVTSCMMHLKVCTTTRNSKAQRHVFSVGFIDYIYFTILMTLRRHPGIGIRMKH